MIVHANDVCHYKISRVIVDYAGRNGYKVMMRMESMMVNYPIITLHSFNTRGYHINQTLVLVKDTSDGFLSADAEFAIIDKARPAVHALIEIIASTDKRIVEETSLDMVKRLSTQIFPC